MKDYYKVEICHTFAGSYDVRRLDGLGLSDPSRVSQSELELGINFDYDFMVSEGAYGSYELYGTVRLSFGPL